MRRTVGLLALPRTSPHRRTPALLCEPRSVRPAKLCPRPLLRLPPGRSPRGRCRRCAGGRMMLVNDLLSASARSTLGAGLRARPPAARRGASRGPGGRRSFPGAQWGLTGGPESHGDCHWAASPSPPADAGAGDALPCPPSARAEADLTAPPNRPSFTRAALQRRRRCTEDTLQ
jgi:hypothetical protein